MLSGCAMPMGPEPPHGEVVLKAPPKTPESECVRFGFQPGEASYDSCLHTLRDVRP
jgi:hypothetical protein